MTCRHSGLTPQAIVDRKCTSLKKVQGAGLFHKRLLNEPRFSGRAAVGLVSSCSESAIKARTVVDLVDKFEEGQTIKARLKRSLRRA